MVFTSLGRNQIISETIVQTPLKFKEILSVREEICVTSVEIFVRFSRRVGESNYISQICMID